MVNFVTKKSQPVKQSFNYFCVPNKEAPVKSGASLSLRNGKISGGELDGRKYYRKKIEIQPGPSRNLPVVFLLMR